MTEIPRIIHTFWDGPELPSAYAEFRVRWRDLNPDWEMMRWDEAWYRDEFSSTATYPYLDSVRWSPVSRHWQWFTDIARLEILRAHGGLWVDADMEPLRPIQPLVNLATSGALIARESEEWLSNAFIGAVLGHPFIEAAVTRLPKRIEVLRGKRCNVVTGPRFLTDLLRTEAGAGVTVLDAALINPFRYDELHRATEEFPDAYVKHHWHNTASALERRQRG